MVVCRYFLQGSCKFGTMCRFDHELNGTSNSYQNTGGSSILRSSNFNTPQIAQPKLNPVFPQEKSNVDNATIVKTASTDMTQAEKGGQWLFSSYAPFKEKPAFPGFEDQSFEEIRLGFYEAQKSGTLEQYKQQIQGMVQEVLVKVRALQAPTPDIVNMLVAIYNTPASQQAGVFSGNSLTNSNTSTFSFKSGSISQQPLFAQANQTSFANNQQQNMFGSSAGNSIFGSGNQNVQNPASNVFPLNNQNNTNSIFGGQTNNTFQSPTSPIQAPSSNIFAQANNNLMPNSNSIFGGQQPTASASIFSNKPEPINTNVFTQQNQPNNLFQSVPQSSNMFGQQPQPSVNNVFNPNPQMNQPQAPSIFNQAQPQFSNPVMSAPKPDMSQPQAYSNSIFGNAQSGGNLTPFATQPPPSQMDTTIYSKLEDLTEEEIKWFQSNDLDISNMPVKPPTYQMCFDN
uniref:Nucleoporin NUP42 n=1 Tax=Diabrotica virgifera virgifera TaxID=50390 RepID=A0A6P7F3B0_DIAVI